MVLPYRAHRTGLLICRMAPMSKECRNPDRATERSARPGGLAVLVLMAIVCVIAIAIPACRRSKETETQAKVTGRADSLGLHAAPSEVQAAAERIRDRTQSIVRMIRDPGEYHGSLVSWVRSTSNEQNPPKYLLLRSIDRELYAIEFYLGVTVSFRDGAVLDTALSCGNTTHADWDTCVERVANTYFRSAADADVVVACFDSGCAIRSIHLTGIAGPSHSNAAQRIARRKIPPPRVPPSPPPTRSSSLPVIPPPSPGVPPPPAPTASSSQPAAPPPSPGVPPPPAPAMSTSLPAPPPLSPGVTPSPPVMQAP